VYDATDGIIKKMLLSTLGGGTHTHDISQIVNVTGHGVVGRITGATGALEHIAATTGTVLRRDAGDLGFGTVPLNAITAAGVTQHQAALSVAWTQLTGVPSTFTPSAHTHAEADIINGTLLARVADAETITGAWNFNATTKFYDGTGITATTTTPIQRVVMWDSSAQNLEYVNDAPLSDGNTYVFAYVSTAGGYQWAASSESIFPWGDVTAAETVSGDWTFTGTVRFEQAAAIVYDPGNANAYFAVDQGNGTLHYYGGYQFRDNGILRWSVYRTNAAAGSFRVGRYDATGVYQDDPIIINATSGNVSIDNRLNLLDATQYPSNSLLYIGASGAVEGSGASSQYDIPMNIDGSAWSYISKGASPDGYVLKLVAGVPAWAANNASDADTLDGQHGTWYQARSNHTGTQAVTTLELLPDGNVVIGGASANTYRALTAADIAAGTFPGANYNMSGNFAMTGTLTVDNDCFISNATNGMLKVSGTMMEYVATSDDSLIPGGWARGLEWNGGGAATACAQVGALGSAGSSISYMYMSVDGTSGSSDYNNADNWRLYSWGVYIGSTQPELRFYQSDGAVDEKYTRFIAAGDALGIASMNDSSGGTTYLWRAYRNGTVWDYLQYEVDDVRYGVGATGSVLFRFYGGSGATSYFHWRTDGQTYRNFSFAEDSAGDFYLYNWGRAVSIQDTWIWGDISTGVLTFAGQRIAYSATQMMQDGFYDNGAIGSGATLNVNWDNGNSQRCNANLGNITIAVNQATAYQGTTYTMLVENVHATTARTVTWTGISVWVGGVSPTASIAAGDTTVVQIFVCEAASGANYIVGSVLLDGATTPA
jgi:hypothetical protein